MQMPYYAYLPAEHTVFTYFGRACHYIASSQIAVFAYLYVVGNMYQIVEFHAFT